MGDLDFLNLDPETEKREDSAVLPAGVYTVCIADATLKNTKDLTGKYVSLELTVLDDEHKNRKVWDIINIKNKSDQAALIGRQTLATICAALGTPGKDTQELVGKTLKVRVAIKPADGQYDAKNTVKKYLPLDAATSDTVPVVDGVPF